MREEIPWHGCYRSPSGCRHRHLTRGVVRPAWEWRARAAVRSTVDDRIVVVGQAQPGRDFRIVDREQRRTGIVDTSLGRLVAIKVLPDVLAHDPERLARFEREARTLAALNHPNLTTVYGQVNGDGVRALVMEQKSHGRSCPGSSIHSSVVQESVGEGELPRRRFQCR